MKTNEIVMNGGTLEARERELAPLAGGQVLLRVEATGVSFAEVQMRRGRYPGQPAFPFVPGYDVVGRVIAVGAGVAPSWIGARAAAMTHVGGWAAHVVLDADALVPVPEGLDAAEVVALVVNGATAWKMLHRVARVRAGQTIVVHGAGGGVGTILVQLARLAGARVIGTCRGAQRASIEALGAIAIDYETGRVLEQVRAIAPDGVDAVFDHVGGASLRASWAMLATRGTLVSYGSASTRDAQGSAWTPIVLNMLRALAWSVLPSRRRARVFDVWGRSSLGANAMLRPARFRRELREDLAQVLALLETGALRAQVAARYSLRDAGLALQRHERGDLVGKIVLVPELPAAARAAA
ncbi:zinc-binding dehydrogenase [Sandaracinus amylolyticus]|uniref:Quinone oxidoreductase n=1 Tax=Sandaracinus amylolyticus TaxID=927083 RepID=A0A0F6W0E6_9BACT|nr:zinc-binding dehydrogenase [Sandaracinus amylolyticus]AKF04230.1 Quinone oxidoreductase [Sandaracinus amylolyticus]